MKALKIVLFLILGLGGLWMLLGLFARNTYRIERQAEIHAPLDIVHEQLRFFKNLKNWSPWHVYDPQIQISIEGTDGEPGATYSWSGNDKVGKGSQVMKAIGTNRIDIDVDWGWGVSPVFFALEERPEGKTKVSWVMDMHVAFPWNAFAMLTDVNAFVGKDFESGLINLGKVCEQIAHPKYRGYEIAEVDLPLAQYAGLRREVSFDDIPAFFAGTFPKVIGHATRSGARINGHPSGFFWSYDTVMMKTDMAAVIPLDKAFAGADSLSAFTVGPKKALVIEYFGDNTKTATAHYAMDDYVAEKKLRVIPPVIEEYVTDPEQEPDTSKWLTKIIYLVEPQVDSTAVPKK
jgi:effector-binding domain-containing protein